MYGKLRRQLALLATLLAVAAAGRPARAAPRPAAQAPFVVVIDPGHGGENRGCRGASGPMEKDVTLTLARELARRLEELLPQARVLLTRTDDRTLTLDDRSRIANARGAHLFLSIHANASPTHDQAGFETYVLDVSASSQDAARTARRENDGALAVPGTDRPALVVLRELTQAGYRRSAAILAAAIQSEQALRFPGRPDRGVRQAPFDVLMGVRAPAVLFEAAFLDHPEDGAVLTDPTLRAKVVDGLAAAVARYYHTVHNRVATER